MEKKSGQFDSYTFSTGELSLAPIVSRGKGKGLDKFGKLGRGRTIYPLEVIAQRVGEGGRLHFRYRQVRSIVFLLMKKSNPFRPKTAFEICGE